MNSDIEHLFMCLLAFVHLFWIKCLFRPSHIFFLKEVDVFIFGCAGSSLLHRLFSSCNKQGLLSCGTRASH